MYVALDDKTEAVLGVVETLKPCTHGVKLRTPEKLTKTITEESDVPRVDAHGDPLYEDAHGVVSTRPIGKRALRRVKVTRVIDVLHEPMLFTADDVREYAKNELWNGGLNLVTRGAPTRAAKASKDAHGILFIDHGFSDYVDMRTSKAIGLGEHRAEVSTGGSLVLQFADVPDGCTATVTVEADGELTVGAGKSVSTARKSTEAGGVAGKRGLVVVIVNKEQRTTVVNAVAVNW